MTANLLEAVRVFDSRRTADDRGYLHVPLDAKQIGNELAFGEVYVVRSNNPGDRRGDHLHPDTTEWFSVVEGRATLQLRDPATGQSRDIALDGEHPTTVHVPAGLAHCLVNDGPGPMIAVAVSSRPFSPDDVIAHRTDRGEEVDPSGVDGLSSDS